MSLLLRMLDSNYSGLESALTGLCLFFWGGGIKTGSVLKALDRRALAKAASSIGHYVGQRQEEPA